LYEKHVELSLDGMGAENPKNPTLWLRAARTWHTGRLLISSEATAGEAADDDASPPSAAPTAVVVDAIAPQYAMAFRESCTSRRAKLHMATVETLSINARALVTKSRPNAHWPDVNVPAMVKRGGMLE
jgi:hypothetical protein